MLFRSAAILERELDSVRLTSNGSRNHAINRAAFVVGQIAHLLGESDDWITEQFLQAAEANGAVQDNGIGSTIATIRSGLAAGKSRPREVTGTR